MIEIFNKYQFSVDNLLNNQSANLVIFSSLPKDFMDIQPINRKKKTIYKYSYSYYLF